MANENKLEEVIRESLDNIRAMVDANTVIGTPITTENGVTVIPVSKVSLGYASGGLDFNGKDGKTANKAQNSGAGGGTGVSVTPVGFLIIKSNGNVEMINVGASAAVANDPIEQIVSLIEKTPELLGRVKAVFKKKTADDSIEIIIDDENDTEILADEGAAE